MKTKSNSRPQTIQLIAGEMEIEAAAGKQRRFSMIAYTGDAMTVGGYQDPIVIDLSGLNIGNSPRPILIDHTNDLEHVFGQSDSIGVANGNLLVDGVIVGTGEKSARVIEMAKSGFKFQASIGASVKSREFVKQGSSVTVNGKKFNGPINVARKSVLSEVSVVTLGADDRTVTTIAANSRREKSIMPMKKNKMQPAIIDDQDDSQIEGDDNTGEIDASHAAAVDAIIAGYLCNAAPGSKDRLDEIKATAISEHWDFNRVQLEALRASRPQSTPRRFTPGSTQRAADSDQLVTASLMLHAGRGELATKVYGERVAQAAHDLRCHSLVDVCATALRLNMIDVPRDRNEMIRAAFSTSSLPTALGAYADKVAADAFRETPGIWEKVSKVRNVNNLRESKIIRTLFVGNYEPIPNGGTIEHGSLKEGDTRTVQAFTKGMMLGITREHIINDDLGVFNDTADALGRAGKRTMNDEFAKTILANAGNFFHNDNGNLGTSGTVLAAGTLAAAIENMAKRTDSEGRSIDIKARILLVPPELEFTALQLLKSAEVMRYTSNSIDNAPTGNPLASALDLLTEARLSNPAYSGYSTTAWYLFASLMDGAINVALLNGRATPTIEQAEAPFNMLGVMFRGYHDFGFRLGEPVAAYKATGQV